MGEAGRRAGGRGTLQGPALLVGAALEGASLSRCCLHCVPEPLVQRTLQGGQCLGRKPVLAGKS